MKANSEKNTNFKYIVILIILIIVLIVLILGVSFAAIFYSKTGEEINKVTTGTMTMSYSENTNGINLENAYPMSDDIGKTLNDENQYFDFTVSATLGGNVIINYAITATKESDSTLPDSSIKVYLTDKDNNEQQVLAPTKISDLTVTNNHVSSAPDGQYLLASGNFSKTISHNYRLRMWISDDYVVPDEIMTYKLRVNVYGAVAA